MLHISIEKTQEKPSCVLKFYSHVCIICQEAREAASSFYNPRLRKFNEEDEMNLILQLWVPTNRSHDHRFLALNHLLIFSICCVVIINLCSLMLSVTTRTFSDHSHTLIIVSIKLAQQQKNNFQISNVISILKHPSQSFPFELNS